MNYPAPSDCRSVHLINVSRQLTWTMTFNMDEPTGMLFLVRLFRATLRAFHGPDYPYDDRRKLTESKPRASYSAIVTVPYSYTVPGDGAAESGMACPPYRA